MELSYKNFIGYCGKQKITRATTIISKFLASIIQQAAECNKFLSQLNAKEESLQVSFLVQHVKLKSSNKQYVLITQQDAMMQNP